MRGEVAFERGDKGVARSALEEAVAAAPTAVGLLLILAQLEEADGLYATCIQHEIDHLNGVLFIDHISKLKRDRIVKKFIKAAKRAAE